MTIRSYLMLIAEQPLLLRLAMAAIAAILFAAAYAVVKLVRAPRQQRPTDLSRNAAPEEPPRVISTAYFW